MYIISPPKVHGEYKVDIAKDVNARLNSYQTGDPERRFSLEFALETPLFRETEEHIHKHLPNRFEWH
ncbi:MAG: GIY-YIG nuclease family protein [Gammaproteobacteria bacterium]|nr:GIY-YIG nuclease family protein [Gammaproteobacteria bacterium]MDE0251286.1 GIY-YIG nuclease family protein [Gammaproteobacteria bacterium]MDE0402029.1 GIY-YIG nuclease family protein [Gammaproteobacteria bacterium]